ncbi:MAG TPA: hypothetical protein VM511_06280, partial [Luteolibacter sp.]|nr:hypothetical protein [Luteolibacter sp.]
LLVNALNDPILGNRCYPREEAIGSAFFHFEAPAKGGHVGFPDATGCWMERRAIVWLDASIQS